MACFHLLSTRRNADGSFETPSLDEVILAGDAAAAVAEARRFPIDQFDNENHCAWLVDGEGQVLWSRDLTAPTDISASTAEPCGSRASVNIEALVSVGTMALPDAA